MGKSQKNISQITLRDVDKFLAAVTNMPELMSLPSEEASKLMWNKALEMGYHPMDMIDAALGSVKYEKSSANLNKPLEDVLNAIYENDPTPGERYVLNPSSVESKKGKELAKELGDALGIAQAERITKGGRGVPEYSLVRDKPTKSITKLLQKITSAGHELRHGMDWLIRPGWHPKNPDPYVIGHHYKDIYEPSELVKEVFDLPQDEKAVKEVLKQSEKLKAKKYPFTRLKGLVPLLVGAGLASYSDQSKAAEIGSRVLDEGDPTSFLLPPQAGEGEDEEVKKMKQEAEEAKREKTWEEKYYESLKDELDKKAERSGIRLSDYISKPYLK